MNFFWVKVTVKVNCTQSFQLQLLLSYWKYHWRKREERCPLTIRLGVRGSVVSSPSGVRGGAPTENGFYAYFRSERSHLEHHFQYFWATAEPPKRRGARENFPPFPPLSTGLLNPIEKSTNVPRFLLDYYGALLHVRSKQNVSVSRRCPQTAPWPQTTLGDRSPHTP